MPESQDSTIEFNGHISQATDLDLQIVEHGGERVLTLQMIDKAHQRPDGTARRNFNANRNRLSEGRHFARVSANEIRTRFPGFISDRTTEDVTVLTERGYLVLVKSFTDDLAWQVQERLVESYFRKAQVAAPVPAALSRMDLIRLAFEAEQELQVEREQRMVLEHKIEEVAPKVAFAEQVAAAEDAITTGEAAKLLGTGRTRLMEFLRRIGWVNRDNEPYQAKVEAGLMNLKVTRWEHPRDGLRKRVTPLVTGKGLAKLHQIYQPAMA